ncbi:MAG: TonB-dependent receptor [Rhodothermales bacterium]
MRSPRATSRRLNKIASLAAEIGFALLFVVAIPSVSAQTTGKIAGVVTDAGFGSGLPGVNVFIEGTTQGTATNVDGSYSIIGVPPGTYTVVASYIGFATQKTENVVVNAGLTVEVDFKLREEVFEGEEIVVVAEKPLVQKDLTATTAIVSGDEIRSLPVENFGQILGLQAGVVNGHFRGGRMGEVGYWVDGMPVTDVFDGSLGVSVENNMVDELQVVTGAFNAEYGQAMSGIVNIVTRDGSNTFSGGIRAFFGDYLTSNIDLFQNLDSVSPTAVHNIEGDFSGPIIKDKLFFNTSARYFANDGHIYGREVFAPQDVGIDQTGRLTLLNPGGSGDSSFASLNPYEKVSGQAKLMYKTGNMKFALTAIASQEDFLGGGGTQDLFFMPQVRRPETKEAFTTFFKVTHTLSASTFYELGLTRTKTNFDSYLYKDPFDERYLDNTYLGFTDGIKTSNFRIGGTDNTRFNRSTETYLGKLDVTSQVDQRNMVKAGLEFRRHDLVFNDQFTAVFPVGNEFETRLITNGYYQRKPIEASAYIQDKIEFDGLIVNIGLRWDYFDSDGPVLADENDPDIVFEERRQALAEGEIFADASAKSQLSPRLGVSFPISERGVVHFSYGWFFQIPNFELLYRNPQFRLGTSGSGLIGLIGNADLRPQKTINGEIGLKQALSNDTSVEITAYFRDINDLAGTATDPILVRGTSARYGKFVNSDFGFIRGMILRFDQRIMDNMSISLDYTYQVAKGNASDPAAVYNAAAAKQEREQQIVPLDWDQLHTANVSMTYDDRANNWGMSIISSFGTGLPYTPQQTTQQTGVILPTTIQLNSQAKPTTWDVDLTAYKSFRMSGGELQIFTKIDNLFDRQNEYGVFGDTGRASYSLQRNVDEASFQGNTAFLDRWYTRPEFYAEPRRVTLGIQYRF